MCKEIKNNKNNQKKIVTNQKKTPSRIPLVDTYTLNEKDSQNQKGEK